MMEMRITCRPLAVWMAFRPVWRGHAVVRRSAPQPTGARRPHPARRGNQPQRSPGTPASRSHSGRSISRLLLVSIVTAPLRARAAPNIVALVVNVMLASATILPRKAVAVPRVAEAPTCHHTLQDLAPLITLTDEPDAVVSVLPIWKTQTALASPSALRTRFPVNPADESKQYDAWRERHSAQILTSQVVIARLAC